MSDTTSRMRVGARPTLDEFGAEWEACVTRAESVHRYYVEHKSEMRPSNSSWRLLETLPSLVHAVRAAGKEMKRISPSHALAPPSAVMLRNDLIRDLTDAFRAKPELMNTVLELAGQVDAAGFGENIHALVKIAHTYQALLRAIGADLSKVELASLVSDEFDSLYLCGPKLSGEKRLMRAQLRLTGALRHLKKVLEEIDRTRPAH